jgi:hypothetical protein
MLSPHTYGGALSAAKRAASLLYTPEVPLATSLCAITSVEQLIAKKTGNVYYSPVDTRRNKSIEETITVQTNALSPESVEYMAEIDYLLKYHKARNYFFPSSLRQQADVCKWFLGGPDLPASAGIYLDEFWEDTVPGNYRVLSPYAIPCSRYEACAGVCYVWDSKLQTYRWDYLKKGPYWSNIQLGTDEWLKHVSAAVPNDWLNYRVNQLLGAKNLELEALALENVVIRKESGPDHVRWARNSAGNLYILGRMFIAPIQDDYRWSSSPRYIGKASNTQFAAITVDKQIRDQWYVGTHGDDWIAWCPHCQRWHSGDYSNWDLHISAVETLASFDALYRRIESYLTKEEQKWFYALAYLAIRTPTLWLWDRNGNPAISPRRTLGKVRSGSGEFIMCPNNSMNQAGTRDVLERAHAELSRAGLKYPCRSKRWWPTFARIAKNIYGWIAKPSAQLTHPHGFIACRSVHTVERAFTPRPTVTSVVRNFVNPASDPLEYPNNSPLWVTARFRELNSTLAWAPDAYDVTIGVIIESALDAGIVDLWGDDVSDSDLSRAMQAVVGQYSTRSYLES